MARKPGKPGNLRLRDLAVLGVVQEQAPVSGNAIKTELDESGYPLPVPKLYMTLTRLVADGYLEDAPLSPEKPDHLGYDITGLGTETLDGITAFLAARTPVAEPAE